MLDALLPGGLARRFALSAAGLAAVAVLVVSLLSWWLISRQQADALEQLALKETQFQAAAVGSDLHALAARMAEVAGSTILATGLVDSAGRETYLTPYLEGIRQINGVPVQLLFTDFEGKEIARNSGASFSLEEREWLKRRLEEGKAAATIFGDERGHFLVAIEPMRYARTRSPEGAMLYKVRVADLHVRAPFALRWGEPDGTQPAGALTLEVPSPPVFQPLAFRVQGARPGRAAAADLSPQYFPVIAVMLGLFVAVVLAGARLATVLTRDLQRLEAFSRQYRGGGGTARAPVVGSAEVASLAQSINQMLDRLDAQHSALMTEQEKLTELAAQLTMADRRKDDFLATLAHELRNPLAPVKTSVAIMKLKQLNDPQLESARDIIARQVQHMARLLDDLLDVSRITRNKLELRLQRVDLAQALNAAIETSRPLLDAARHHLRVDLPPEPIALEADPVRLAQIFANLLNNAAKFTAAGGQIDIKVRREEEWVTVSIKDDGVGIPEEQLPRIFEMFTQARATLQGEGGLGIGLSLVRGLVEMHGGTIAAHSDGPGEGSEFVVRLKSGIEGPALAPDGATSQPDMRAPLRIIVADDNRDAADSLATVLTLWGHRVRTAYDGVEALELCRSFEPEVVFLDIGMPRMNGYEAAERLRREPCGKTATLIALTGWGQESDRARAREAGFDRHLVKPANPQELEQVLNDLPTHV